LRKFQNCINCFLFSAHVSVGSASTVHLSLESAFLPDSARAVFLEQRLVIEPNASAVVYHVKSDWLSQFADLSASSSPP